MAITGIIVAGIISFWYKKPPTVKVGLIFSLSGIMSNSEKPLKDAALFAIREINQAGGLQGHQIEPVIADSKSDWVHAASEAERLITEEKVVALFACWTSTCRKSVKRIVEKHKHLLFYPLQYEGLEQSEDIFYTGAAPNQQIIPALAWGMKNFGSRIFLVGSDYIFPKTANLIIKETAFALGASIVGERYLPLDSNAVSSIVEEIKKLQPDFVINTINGKTNLAFFRALQETGLSAMDVPIISSSIAEGDFIGNPGLTAGHYVVWSYFQSIDTLRNQQFIRDFKKFTDPGHLINDPMESVYISIQLWANAVRDANTFNPDRVKRALLRQSLDAPQGIVSVDPFTHHLWRTIRIGKSRGDGNYEIAWSSEFPIRPSPFPELHNREEWFQLITDK